MLSNPEAVVLYWELWERLQDAVRRAKEAAESRHVVEPQPEVVSHLVEGSF